MMKTTQALHLAREALLAHTSGAGIRALAAIDAAQAQPPEHGEDKPEFRKAVEHAINCNSMENGSNSPDFLLAQYLSDCLAAFDKAVMHRECWYGRATSSPDGLMTPNKK